MGLLFTSYNQGYTEETETCDPGTAISLPITLSSNQRVALVYLYLGRTAYMVSAVNLKFGDSPGDDSYLSSEISSGLLRPNSISRISVTPNVDLPAGTSYLTLTVPGSGSLLCKGIPSASSAGGVSIGSVKTLTSGGTSWGDGDYTLCIELYDSLDSIRTARTVDCFRKSLDTPYKRDEAAMLNHIYASPIEQAWRWVIDDYTLPTNPHDCNIIENISVGEHATIDAQSVLIFDQASDSPRVVKSHTIEATFGLVGVDMVQFLKTYQDFNRACYVEVKLFDPVYPEVCYMNELEGSAYYLKRYFGTLGHWREDPTTVAVYVNGVLADPGGYSVDFRSGAVTLDNAQNEDAIVQVSYIWRPRVKIHVDPNYEPKRGYAMAKPKVTMYEVADDE